MLSQSLHEIFCVYLVKTFDDLNELNFFVSTEEHNDFMINPS